MEVDAQHIEAMEYFIAAFKNEIPQWRQDLRPAALKPTDDSGLAVFEKLLGNLEEEVRSNMEELSAVPSLVEDLVSAANGLPADTATDLLRRLSGVSSVCQAGIQLSWPCKLGGRRQGQQIGCIIPGKH